MFDVLNVLCNDFIILFYIGRYNLNIHLLMMTQYDPKEIQRLIYSKYRKGILSNEIINCYILQTKLWS